MAGYDEEFFRERHGRTQHAARVVLGVVSEFLPRIESAVDVGCGVGTWLSVLREHGALVVQGVDGPWVNRQHLVIPPECFLTHDLSRPLNLGRRFDLAISLEVAEHLPADCAGGFVQTLTGLADVVLFSAAIPLQGGRGHVNEQWPEYWAGLFGSRNFRVFDAIRPRIWSDRTIPTWYRQNILLFVSDDRVPALVALQARQPAWPLSLVHPEIYLKVHRKRSGLRKLLRALRGR
jgi:hypothetical protein